MPYTTINKSTDYFNTLIYTGNGSDGNSITGVGFKPDWVWTKNRDHTADHYIHDIVRGVQNAIRTNNDSGTYATSINLQSFDSDGFTLGTQDGLNKSGDSIVSWNWLTGGTSGSSNGDGSTSSTVSANTTSGFSIVKWSGTGSTTTVGHGLGAIPACFITKSTGTGGWGFYHQSVGNTKALILNETGTGTTHAAYYNNTSPTSSVFTVNSDASVNHSGNDMIAYCFAEKTGYSKFGDYTGNGSADGTFVYTGFKPAFILSKNTSATQRLVSYR